MPSAWPSGEDLKTLMIAEGHVTSALFTTDFYQRKIDVAVATWDQLTGWSPYLSTGTSSTKTLDPNGSKILQLPTGILSLTSLVVNDVTYTQDTDFWLQGSDTVFPNHYVLFASGVSGLPKTIEITGTWGFSTTVDSIAYEAILNWASARVIEARYGEGGAASEKEQGSLRVRYQGTTGTMQGKSKPEVLTDLFNQAVALRERFGVALGNGY